jgi:hypothetical protein
LIDLSKGPLTSSICMARGLADIVFDDLVESKNAELSSSLSNNSTFTTSSSKDDPSKMYNLTDSSTVNSESISIDSGRSSSHWSVPPENQMPSLGRKRAVSIGNLYYKEKTTDRQYYDFCYRKIHVAKLLAQQRKTRSSQHRENIDLQNIKRHLNTSSDEFEGIFNFQPNKCFIRKAKSVSFVDKLSGDLSDLRQNKSPSSRTDNRQLSRETYERLSESSEFFKSHCKNRVPSRNYLSKLEILKPSAVRTRLEEKCFGKKFPLELEFLFCIDMIDKNF